MEFKLNMHNINMTKHIKGIIFLACTFMLACTILLPLNHANATSTTDCPAPQDNSLRDSASLSEQQKYWYSEYCRNNYRGAPPFSEGPFHIPSLSGVPASWVNYPVFIPSDLTGVACDITDEERDSHPQMSHYLLPKDCVDKGIDYFNFWVELKHQESIVPPNAASCPGNVCPQDFTVRLSAGESYYHWHTGAEYRAEVENDRLCVYALLYGVVERFVDCRKLPPPPPAAPPNQACWIAASCASFQAIEHQWFVPVTALITQCVTDTVNGIFVHGRNFCPPGTETAFQRIQNNVRQTIRIILILYIVVVGYKVVLGELHNKAEIMMMIVKFSLVLYFALAEGWQTYFTGLTGAANDLAHIVFSGALAQYDYCQFPHLGAADYGAGYSWMALWDSIDCKLYYYLGFRREGYPHLIMILIANLFGFAFFMIFLLVSFIVIFFKFIFYAVRAYVIAIFAIAILVYISPMMIPLALFEPTKSYFKKWMDELIGYVIYPMMLFAAMAMLLTAFDSIYWGEATMHFFDPTDGYLVVDCGGNDILSQGRSITTNSNYNAAAVNAIRDPSQPVPDPVGSMGCYLEGVNIDWHDVPLLSIEWPIIDDDPGEDMILEVLKACLFAFIFAHFLEHLNQLIQAITGTFRTAGKAMPKAPDKKDFASAAAVGAVAGVGVIAQVGVTAAMMAGGGGGGGGGDPTGGAGGAGGGDPTGGTGGTGAEGAQGGQSADASQSGQQQNQGNESKSSQDGKQDSQQRNDNQNQDQDKKDKKDDKKDDEDKKKKKKKKGGDDDEEENKARGGALVGASASESEETPDDDSEGMFFAGDDEEDDDGDGSRGDGESAQDDGGEEDEAEDSDNDGIPDDEDDEPFDPTNGGDDGGDESEA